jgi:hypothetical protein
VKQVTSSPVDALVSLHRRRVLSSQWEAQRQHAEQPRLVPRPKKRAIGNHPAGALADQLNRHILEEKLMLALRSGLCGGIMKSVRYALLISCLAVLQSPALAQQTSAGGAQAQVTFYSSGSFAKSILPGYKYGKFIGRIMVEHDQLAMLTPGHYVTFNLDPGEHTLSNNSWMIARPEGGGHVKVDLVGGKHYYIATFLRSVPIGWDFRMELRSCEQAQKDNEHATPLDQEHLKEYGKSRVIAETTFPACP